MTPSSRTRLLLATVVILAGLAYLPGLFSPFYLDDQRNIAENRNLRLAQPLDLATLTAPNTLIDPSRPLSYYSFYLNGLVTGLSPAGLRGGNILLHLLNIALAFLFFRALLLALRRPEGEAAAGALAGAALWGLHPLNSQPVLYVVQRMTVLSSTFVLLGLILYLAGRGRGGRARWVRWGGVPVCLALAFLCKPLGVLLLAGIVLMEMALPPPAAPLPARRRWLAAGMVLAAIVILLSFHTLFLPDYSGWHRPYTPGERVLTEGRVVAHYASLFFLPAPGRLHLIYDPVPSSGWLAPPSTLAAWLLLGAALAAVFGLRRRAPLWALAVAWFLVLHAPEAGPFSLEIAFEHRNYLPTLLPALACGALLAAPLAGGRAGKERGRSALLLAVSALLLLLAGATATRAALWADREGMIEHDRRAFPASARLAYQRAKLLKDGGKAEEARSSLLRYLAETPSPIENSRGRGVADILVLLGNLARQRGDAAEAEARYLESLQAAPGQPLAWFNLAALYIGQGRRREALQMLDDLERAVPDWPGLSAARRAAMGLPSVPPSSPAP
jgi:protein O-mannosyl-transferase